jgi:hypothetical protein
LGSKRLANLLKMQYRPALYAAIIIFFFWPIKQLCAYHPYENTYFNFLIGGIKGAKNYNFPSWGNTFGVAYKEGIEWINKNAPPDAKLTLIQGTPANIPLLWVRNDIDYQNINFSGINREGEYIMELIFNDTGKSYHYKWEYTENFLVPVYEVKVQDVTILRIWKNDLEHTREELKKRQKTKVVDFTKDKDSNTLTFDLESTLRLTSIKLIFDSNECLPLQTGFFETSQDKINWKREKDWVPFPQLKNHPNLTNQKIEFLLAAKDAKYVRFISDNIKSCPNKNPIEATITYISQ